jgi:hypothetical protein
LNALPDAETFPPHVGQTDGARARGQYRMETLIAQFGGDVLMPDVRHLIAQWRVDATIKVVGALRSASLKPPPFSFVWRRRGFFSFWGLVSLAAQKTLYARLAGVAHSSTRSSPRVR